MKTIKKIIYIIPLLLGLIGCDSYLDRSPMSEYLSNDFYQNAGAIKQATNGVYQSLYMTSNNIPFCTLYDIYTPMGIERADNNSIGVNNQDLTGNFTIETHWANFYKGVARANSVLDGAAPFYSKLDDEAKRYLAEVKVIRAYHYSHLVFLWGDIPFFTSILSEAEMNKQTRRPWQEVVDFLLEDLDDAANFLVWKTSEMGRVDKSVALGLKARIALYAASWHKFGYGESGVKDVTKANEYYKIAADAANEVILLSGRKLAPKFGDLFTRQGQMTTDAQNENMFSLMYSDQGITRWHYISLGEQSRMFAQSGRFPTQLLVDIYEMKNGKRIDEPGSEYDPKKPFENRDPRLRMTVYSHHDTIIGNTGGQKQKFLMELYKPTTTSFLDDGTEVSVTNLDFTGSVAQYGYVQSGVGYLWKKYNHFNDEPVSVNTYNFILMRYAEILLTYAEAKIEVGEIDPTVYAAIDEVRTRAGLPGILTVDPERADNQLKLRQIVRRERKVELTKESGNHFFDMRRWRTAALENAEPTYGFPKASKEGIDGYTEVTPDMVPSYGESGSERDINDMASYEAYKTKLRTRDISRPNNWRDMLYLWPIPQTERNKAPQLEQNSGYGQ